MIFCDFCPISEVSRSFRLVFYSHKLWLSKCLATRESSSASGTTGSKFPKKRGGTGSDSAKDTKMFCSAVGKKRPVNSVGPFVDSDHSLRLFISWLFNTVLPGPSSPRKEAGDHSPLRWGIAVKLAKKPRPADEKRGSNSGKRYFTRPKYRSNKEGNLHQHRPQTVSKREIACELALFTDKKKDVMENTYQKRMQHASLEAKRKVV